MKLLHLQVDGIKIEPFGLCPTTHPYPFLGGKSCCQEINWSILTNVETAKPIGRFEKRFKIVKLIFFFKYNFGGTFYPL